MFVGLLQIFHDSSQERPQKAVFHKNPSLLKVMNCGRLVNRAYLNHNSIVRSFVDMRIQFADVQYAKQLISDVDLLLGEVIRVVASDALRVLADFQILLAGIVQKAFHRCP